MNPFRLLSSVGKRLSSNISPRRHKPTEEALQDEDDNLAETPKPKRRKVGDETDQNFFDASVTATIRDANQIQEQLQPVFESRIYTSVSGNLKDKQTSALSQRENIQNTKRTPTKYDNIVCKTATVTTPKPNLIENRAIPLEVIENSESPRCHDTPSPKRNACANTSPRDVSHPSDKNILPAVPPSTPPSRLKRKRSSVISSVQAYQSPTIKGNATSTGSPRVPKFPSIQKSSLLKLVPADDDSDDDGNESEKEPSPAVGPPVQSVTPAKAANSTLPSLGREPSPARTGSSPAPPQTCQSPEGPNNATNEVQKSIPDLSQSSSKISDKEHDDDTIDAATQSISKNSEREPGAHNDDAIDTVVDNETPKSTDAQPEATPQRTSTLANSTSCKTPSSVTDSKRKKVAFLDSRGSTNFSSNSSPSNGSPGNLKSILKPVAPIDETAEKSSEGAQPILEDQSLEEILNSFERALSSGDGNTKRTLYLTLSTVIMANDEAKVSKDMQYRLADILREMDADIERELQENAAPVNRNISSAYKIAGYLLTIPEIAKALDWKVGLNYVHRSICQLNKHNTDSKSQAFVHLKFLSSNLFIYSTILQGNLISDALVALKSLQYKSSMSILCEKLAIYERFIEKGGSYMLRESKDWMNEVITCLVHPSATIRNRAITVTNIVILKCSVSSYDNGIVAHCVYSIFHSADRRDAKANPQVINVFVRRLQGLLRSGDVTIAMTIWGNILMLLQHQDPGGSETKVEQWEHLRIWMSVLRECFDIGTVASRQAAFEALRNVVYLWAFSPLLTFYDSKDDTKTKMRRRIDTLLYAFKKNNGESNKVILLDIFATIVYLTLRPCNTRHDQRLVYRIVWKNIIFPVVTYWKDDKSMILKVASILKNTLTPLRNVEFEPCRALQVRGFLESNNENSETLGNYMCLPPINVAGESASIILPNIFKMLILTNSPQDDNHTVLELWDTFLVAMTLGSDDGLVTSSKQSASIMIGILNCTEFIAASMAELPSKTVSEIIQKFVLRVGFSRLTTASLVFDYFEQKLSSTTTPADLLEKAKAFKSLKKKNVKPNRGGAEVEDLLNNVPNWNKQFSPLAYLFNAFASSYGKEIDLAEALAASLVDQSIIDKALFYKECINLVPIVAHDERDKGLPTIWNAFAKPYLVELSNFDERDNLSCNILDCDTVCLLLEYIDPDISSFDIFWAASRLFYGAFDNLYKRLYFRKHPDLFTLVSRASRILDRQSSAEPNNCYRPSDALSISSITSIFSVFGDVLLFEIESYQRDQLEFDVEAFMSVVKKCLEKTPYCQTQKSIIPIFFDTTLFFLWNLLKGADISSSKARICRSLIELIPAWLEILESQALTDTAAKLISFCQRMEMHKESYSGIPIQMIDTMADTIRAYTRRQHSLNETTDLITINRDTEPKPRQTIVSHLLPKEIPRIVDSSTIYSTVHYTLVDVQAANVDVQKSGDMIPASVSERSSTQYSESVTPALISAGQEDVVTEDPSVTSEEISLPRTDGQVKENLESLSISRLLDSNLQDVLESYETDELFELETKLMDTLVRVRSLQKQKRDAA